MEKEKLSNSDLMSELENRLEQTQTTEKAIKFLKEKIEDDELSDDEITEIYDIIESDCDEIQNLKDNCVETDINDFSASQLIEALNDKDTITVEELAELDDDIIEILLEMLSKKLSSSQLRELICMKYKMQRRLTSETFASEFFREFSSNIYSFV